MAAMLILFKDLYDSFDEFQALIRSGVATFRDFGTGMCLSKDGRNLSIHQFSPKKLFS